MQDEYNDIVLENDAPYVNDGVAANDSIVAAPQNITEFHDSEAHTTGKINQVVLSTALAASLFAVIMAATVPTPSVTEISVDGVAVTSFIDQKTLSVDFVINDPKEELEGFEVFIEDGGETKTLCEVNENDLHNSFTATAELPDGTDTDGLTFVLSVTTKEGWTGEICRRSLTLNEPLALIEKGAWAYIPRAA